MSGIERIAAERKRQIEEEGWSAEHDDQHQDGSLAIVAALYATPKPLYRLEPGKSSFLFYDPWPGGWHNGWDKRKRDSRGRLCTGMALPVAERIRQLEKAGALIAAEIDRLERVLAK